MGGVIQDLTPRPPLHHGEGVFNRDNPVDRSANGTVTVSALNTPSPYMERGTGEVRTMTESEWLNSKFGQMYVRRPPWPTLAPEICACIWCRP